MKNLRLWIAAVGFSGILCLAAVAQETRIALVTPNSASVIVDEHRATLPEMCSISNFVSIRPQTAMGKGEVRVLFE